MVSRILIICGPTASGKSARAIDIAQSLNGVIINADAMQVYADLRILTARPTPEDEAIAPHALYGVLPAGKACSAARWLELARPAIAEAAGNGCVPIVTGGTGLYLKALMEGLSPIPDIPAAIREQARQLWQTEGAAALAVRDSVMAARLKPGDTQRGTRALEVWLATGRSLADWQDMPRIRPFPEAAFEIISVTLERAELYRRCDARFLAMMEAGGLAEAKALHTQRLDPALPALRAVGVPELFGYLDGEWDLDTAIAKGQQATRNYAKRQMTWFRHQL